VKPSERQQAGERNILKEVDMQVLDPKSCEVAIRKSIGNPQYYFDPQSFVCAGGEPGRGICKGEFESFFIQNVALICFCTIYYEW
jgi:hypothetical protein